MRSIKPDQAIKLILIPICILFFPFVIVTLLIAHLSIIFNIGSTTDPLGYTILLKK
jgi:hypothetical protein